MLDTLKLFLLLLRLNRGGAYSIMIVPKKHEVFVYSERPAGKECRPMRNRRYWCRFRY